MPLRVKLGIGLACALWLGAGVAAVFASAQVTPAGSAAIVVVLSAAGSYLVFVYYPKFDPTGLTLWRAESPEPSVALTFDDGPGPDTAAIIESLDRHGAKATFFFLGANAKRLPELVDRARRGGHAIGNHGFSHTKMHRLDRAAIEREIAEGEAAVGGVSSVRGRKLLRVPHGFKSVTLVRAARRLGYALVGWTAGVWDSDRPGSDVIARRAAAALKPGCVLLLHDGDGARPDADRSQTAAALEKIINSGLKAGYKFVTIPELFAGQNEPERRRNGSF